MELYPPILDDNNKSTMGCTFCDKIFDSKKSRANTKPRYVRHVGVVHGKIYGLIRHLDFSKINETDEVKKSEEKPVVIKSEVKKVEVKKPKPRVEIVENSESSDEDTEPRPKPNENEIWCKDCEEVFPTREARGLHTCESNLDEYFAVEETKERNVKPRSFSQDPDTPPKPTPKTPIKTPSKTPTKSSKIDLKEAKISLKRISENRDEFSDEEEDLEPLKKVAKKSKCYVSTKYPYSCPFCDSKLDTVFDLEKHLLADHYNELPTTTYS